LITYLTFKVESCNNPKVTFESNKVIFAGDDHYTSDKYYNELEMFDEIKPEVCILYFAFLMFFLLTCLPWDRRSFFHLHNF